VHRHEHDVALLEPRVLRQIAAQQIVVHIDGRERAAASHDLHPAQ
jgi:hypothetical protein